MQEVDHVAATCGLNELELRKGIWIDGRAYKYGQPSGTIGRTVAYNTRHPGLILPLGAVCMEFACFL